MELVEDCSELTADTDFRDGELLILPQEPGGHGSARGWEGVSEEVLWAVLAHLLNT